MVNLKEKSAQSGSTPLCHNVLPKHVFAPLYVLCGCCGGVGAPKGAGAQPAYGVLHPRSSLSPLRGALPKAIELLCCSLISPNAGDNDSVVTMRSIKLQSQISFCEACATIFGTVRCITTNKVRCEWQTKRSAKWPSVPHDISWYWIFLWQPSRAFGQCSQCGVQAIA